ITPKPVDWLWRGFLPRGRLVVLDGDPGTGKTSVVLDVIARVSRGLELPDGSAPTEPMGALIMSAEDDAADTLVPRLRAADADLDRIATMPEIRDQGIPRPIQLPQDLPAIEREIRAYDAGVV